MRLDKQIVVNSLKNIFFKRSEIRGVSTNNYLASSLIVN
jgi:hypothetical protein